MENEYLKEIERLKKLIEDHNQECLNICLNNTNCDPSYYGPQRGKRECPECPRAYIIDESRAINRG